MLRKVRRGARQLKIDVANFWFQPERWPADTKDRLFLARAVMRLGHAIGRSTWQGLWDDSHLLTTAVGAKVFDIATEFLARAGAEERLEFSVAEIQAMRVMTGHEWTQIDRIDLFHACRLPMSDQSGGSAFPVYVEKKRLPDLIGFYSDAAAAISADQYFNRIKRERFSLASPPTTLAPPPGFLSVDGAISALSGDTHAEKLDALKRMLAAGQARAIVQFWETGRIKEMLPSDWLSIDPDEALADNGIVSIPENPIDPNSLPLLAFLRVGVAQEIPSAKDGRAAATPLTAPQEGHRRAGSTKPSGLGRMRTRTVDDLTAEFSEIRRLRRALQQAATESKTRLNQSQLLSAACRLLGDANETKRSRLKQILRGTHDLSNKLMAGDPPLEAFKTPTLKKSR